MKWYVIEYDDQRKKGCPSYLKGDLSYDWEWDSYDPDPFRFSISKDYVFKARHSFLNFDFWSSGPLVSEDFVGACNMFGASYRLVPVKVIQSGGQEAEKKYFYMLFSGAYEILDYNKSDLLFRTNLETGGVVYRKHFASTPFIYSIYRAVIDERKFSGNHVFRCLDILNKIVCSEDFKGECERRKLLGLRFVEINESFHSIDYGDKSHPDLQSSI